MKLTNIGFISTEHNNSKEDYRLLDNFSSDRHE